LDNRPARIAALETQNQSRTQVVEQIMKEGGLEAFIRNGLLLEGRLDGLKESMELYEPQPESSPAEPIAPETIKIFLDGDQYCAVREATFINLQESDAGFGSSPEDAVRYLLEEERLAAEAKANAAAEAK